MSESPAARPGGTPNGSRPTFRRPRNTDPLVRKPNRQRDRRPQPKLPAKVNGVTGQDDKKSSGQAAVPSPQPGSNAPANESAQAEPPKPVHSIEYPLFTTKRELKQGLRHHIARFYSKKNIDLTNDQEFTRPVRLHRRDPRAPPGGAGGTKHEAAPETKEEMLDSKERERQEILKQEKEAQRQADLAQIAPNVNQPNAPPKKNAFQKKTQQVYRSHDSPAQQKQNKIRYEESLPWHLEDFDNKNVWVGSYEQALSEIHMGLVVGQDSFHLVPVEKWYKFKPTNLFPTLSLEEAEALQKKRGKEPRWVMDSQNADKVKQEEDRNRKMNSKLFLGKWESQGGARPSATNMKSEFADADELDFDDAIDDDEGDAALGGDEEDVKQAETRIKREQRNANFFDMNDERDVDKEEEETKKERERAKRLSKGVRKALVKREKNDDYDTTDSDRNPYSSESDSEDTDEEMRKEEERKKAEEKAEKTKPKDATKPSSGNSSKGTNTPSGRNKHSDPLKKPPSSLKRAGSPNLSEASGNESTRKKHKKKHVTSSSQPTGTSTPVPGSRQMSPAPTGSNQTVQPSRKSSVIKLPVDSTRLTEISSTAPRPNHKRPRGEMGSDADDVGPGGSGGETKKKIKLKIGAGGSGSPPGGSPQGSRAGSPNPPSTSPGLPKEKKKPATTGTKPAGAPASTNPSSPEAGAPSDDNLPSHAEVIAEIPGQGISIKDLVNKFRSRNVSTASWRSLLAKTAVYGEDKLLRRKP